MKYLSKLISLLRSIWNLPGIKQVARKTAVSIIRASVADSSNKIDDKVVQILDVAYANRNYRAVLNGKAKK